MTTEELKNVTVAKSVDARGTACPGPLLAAKKAIGDDIPRWCNKMEHDFLGMVEEDSFTRLFLKKA